MRSFPILYNKQIEKTISEEEIPQPIIADNSTSEYQDVKGIIFLTIGTAGDELTSPEENPDFLVIQDSEEYGFLNLKIENNGNTIVGEFIIAEDENNIDKFELIKS